MKLAPRMPVPQTREQLRALVAGLLDEPAEQLADGDDLILDWGLDSMRVMGLVEDLNAGGVRVTMRELAERPTIAAWDALLAERRTASASA